MWRSIRDLRNSATPCATRSFSPSSCANNTTTTTTRPRERATLSRGYRANHRVEAARFTSDDHGARLSWQKKEKKKKSQRGDEPRGPVAARGEPVASFPTAEEGVAGERSKSPSRANRGGIRVARRPSAT